MPFDPNSAELVSYMQHITNLNRERNKKIIAQAQELNNLLLANSITPIFLKGTSNFFIFVNYFKIRCYA